MNAYACGECGARFSAPGVCPTDGAPLAANDDPLVGTMVGRYRLARVIGRGGMGCVYAAHQPELGSQVAIKVISEHHARDPVLAARFFAEARAVNLIRHENIVNVTDFVALPDGRPAIVMELLTGRSLRDLVKAELVPLGGLVHVAIEVLSALAAAHALGIIHRDLKPDNIMITTSGRVKVLDFGIAKLATGMTGQPLPRTRTGVVLGTPEYMAPEQISGGTADHRTDLYAFAVVLFEALIGRRPFDGPTDFEVMRAHVDDPPPSLRGLRPGLPVELEQVVLCALAKDPDRRFASAGAMANALHQASAAIPPGEWRSVIGGGRMSPGSLPAMPAPKLPTAEHEPLASETVRERPSGRARRVATAPSTVIARPRRGRWIALAAGAALAVVAIVVGLTRDRAPSTPTIASGPGSADSGTPDAAAPPDAATTPVHDARSAEVVRTILYGALSDPGRFDPSLFVPDVVAPVDAGTDRPTRPADRRSADRRPAVDAGTSRPIPAGVRGCACRENRGTLCPKRRAPLCRCQDVAPDGHFYGTFICAKWVPCTGDVHRCEGPVMCEDPRFRDFARPGEQGTPCSGVTAHGRVKEGRLNCSATEGCNYHVYTGRTGDPCTGYTEAGELDTAILACD